MTPNDIALVQNTFRKIGPIADQAAALFYARLFELDPVLRTLFRGDLHEQGHNLMSMMAMAIASLDRPDLIVPALQALGVRHSGYGAIEEHYASIGAALLWTLQKGLGPEFTPAVCSAWTDTYSFLAKTMIEAQRSARVAA